MGEAGVGGGGWGGRSADVTVVMGDNESRCAMELSFTCEISFSVSDPEESSSQLSATGLDFGGLAGFCGTLAESSR